MPRPDVNPDQGIGPGVAPISALRIQCTLLPLLQSSEGVQQGDPLGPLLFCLVIQPLIEQLTSEFVVSIWMMALSVAGLGRPPRPSDGGTRCRGPGTPVEQGKV